MTEAIETSGHLPDPGFRHRYPWHTATWTRLTADRMRLPHALLLQGPAGLGKRAFAWRFAQWLLCLNPREHDACGDCTSCNRFVAGTHPDLLSVGPEEEASTIAVDQIRGLRDFVVLKPHTSMRKLVIVDPADRMNLNAANALLKVLEEPPADSLLVLVTSRPTRLPATIRSRCSAVTFRTPNVETALAWLKNEGVEEPAGLLRFSAGAPLVALAVGKSSDLKEYQQVATDIEALRNGSGDPLGCAIRWKNLGAERCLTWFQAYIVAVIRDEASIGKNSIYLIDLFRFFDVISRARAEADGPLDETLMLEDLLIGWAGIFRRLG